MARTARRTNLGRCPELQFLIRMAAEIGPAMAHAAEALITANYCFETAAHLLVTWGCGSCGWSAAMGMVQGIDARNARCPMCRRKLRHGHVEAASLRQRVHRLQKTMQEMLGPGFVMEQRRRPQVRFSGEEGWVERVAVEDAG